MINCQSIAQIIQFSTIHFCLINYFNDKSIIINKLMTESTKYFSTGTTDPVILCIGPLCLCRTVVHTSSYEVQLFFSQKRVEQILK